MNILRFLRHPAPLVLFSMLAALIASAAPSQNGQALVYFGTYTGKKSKGIYVARFDLAKGTLATPELAMEATNPSFLAAHPNRRFLYAVNEISKFNGKSEGAVSAFAIDSQTGHLSLLNQHSSGGDGPCHLIVDKAGRNVLVANYGGGSVAVLPVARDGSLRESGCFIQHQGKSVDARRQEAPHAHGIYLDSANRFAYAPDLGLDKVMIYRFAANKSELTPNDPASGAVAPGAGPRHFAFHPKGRFAYVINEMRCTVTAFACDPKRGELQELQNISTLPPGVPVQPGYSTAELFAHPAGKFLYGSNRGHDTLVVYAIDEKTGRLTLVEHTPTQGKIPRSFGLDPAGRWLLAANQNSDSVVVFRIDQKTGHLTSTGQSIEVGAPVSVVFVPAK